MPLREAEYQQLAAQWQTCPKCPLGSRKVNRPGEKLPGHGAVTSPIVFLAQNPSVYRKGRAVFGGTSDNDQTFINGLRAHGIRREDVFVTNVVKCSTPGNQTPDWLTINICQSWVIQELTVLRPQILIAVGSVAARFLASVQESPTRQLRASVKHPAYFLRIGRRQDYRDEFVPIAPAIRAALRDRQ